MSLSGCGMARGFDVEVKADLVEGLTMWWSYYSRIS